MIKFIRGSTIKGTLFTFAKPIGLCVKEVTSPWGQWFFIQRNSFRDPKEHKALIGLLKYFKESEPVGTQ